MNIFFWRRNTREADLQRELESHLDLETEERGDAYSARKALGNTTLIREDTRAAWGWGSVERFGQDLRYAARVLRRSPGFTAMAVMVVALGIGPVVAIFSVVDQFLLRSLPFPQPDRIYRFTQFDKQSRFAPSLPRDFAAIREHNKTFDEIGGIGLRTVELTGVPEPQQLSAELSSSDMFRVLGVQPLLGRTFLPAEDQPGAEPVVVLGEQLWRGSFGSDPNILMKPVVLDGQDYRVVGVMPGGFHGVQMSDWTNLWLPLSQPGQRSPAASSLNLYGRLKSGATEREARAEMEVIAGRLGTGIRVQQLREVLVSDYRTELLLMFGFSGLLLLIGCTNIANLLLARSSARVREMVVRAAIGAGPLRLMRQALTESLLVVVAGGAIGVALAVGVLGRLVTLGLDGPLRIPVSADLRLLAFAMAATFTTAMLCGLFPALETARMDISHGMKEAARSSQGRRSYRTRSLLLVGEVALSLTLLAGAATLIHSFLLVRPDNPGFETRNRTVLTLYLSAPRFRPPESQTAFLNQALEQLKVVPGVQSVAATSWLPFSGMVGIGPVQTDGGATVRANSESVSTDYLAVMSIPLLAGRAFSRADVSGADAVAIVNEAFAEAAFNGRSAVGRHIQIEVGARQKRDLTIIGVAGNVRSDPEPRRYRPFIYLPFDQIPSPHLDLVVVTTLPSAAMAPQLERAVHSVDPNQSIRETRTIDEMVNQRLGNIRTRSWLMGAAAGIALLLAAAGIYAVVAYGVTQRTREIGIRTALGASKRDVLNLVMRQGGFHVAVGLALGCAGAWFAVRLLARGMFRVYPIGVPTFAGIVAILALVAILATLAPARRALHVDPMTALRDE